MTGPPLATLLRHPALSPFRLPAAILALAFAIFTGARVVLRIAYPGDFASIPPSELASAFLRGLVFDGSVIATLLGPPLLVVASPAGPAWLKKAFAWAAFALLLVATMVLVADVVFFGFSHRHIGPEIGFLGTETGLIIDMALRDHLWVLGAFAGAAAVGGLLWRRLLAAVRECDADPPPLALRYGLFGAAVLATGLVAWGGVRPNPLRVVVAFERGSPEAAQLVLNGPFSVLQTLRTENVAAPLPPDLAPWEGAIALVREEVVAPGEALLDPEYPLLRRPAPRAPAAGPVRKPNVVVVLLEGWDAPLVGALSAEGEGSADGLTPRFDALSREGVLFTSFYANGPRSMDGIASASAGFTRFPGLPYLGHGMEASRLAYLGHMAAREGYETFFAQADIRRSFRLDVLAPHMGFATYWGAEDVAARRGASPRGWLDAARVWDHELLETAGARLASARRPFLAVLFTVTTHPPFGTPDASYDRFPPDDFANRYRNSLGYADAALGRFFDEAKASGWYESTVFVVTADHVSGIHVRPDDPRTQHRVPCLILGGGIAARRDARIGSHLDLVPTIADLAGWTAPHAALGRSLFDERVAPERGAVCVNGTSLLRVERGGYVRWDQGRRVAGRALEPGASLDDIERRLLSFVHVALTLHRRNRIAPPGLHAGQ